MTAYKNAYQTCASTPAKSIKDNEIEIILDITRRLKLSAESRNEDFATFTKALHDNRRLWITFAADVVNSENRLPNELRARIFFLSEFIQEYTRKVLAQKLSIEPILDINLAVLRGLTAKRHSG